MLDSKKVKIGIAPIAWTNDDMPDLGAENTFEQCASEMALAGYTGCEVGNKFPKDIAELKRALDLRGLQICNQWFSSFVLTKPFETVEHDCRLRLEFLKKAGAKIIGFSEQSYSIQGQISTPVFGNKYVMNNSEWDTLAKALNKLGKIALEEYGINLAYHHHMGTVVQDEAEVDIFLKLTDPKYVSLLYDTGHFAMAGYDPLKMIQKYIGRIKHIHLKDYRPQVLKAAHQKNLSFLDAVRAGVFTVPGDGAIDFKPIFSVIENSGYTGYMLVEAEQDPSKANPLEYAIKAREYIRKTAGI